MSDEELRPAGRHSALRMPRTRGVGSGSLLILAGLWGALVPFLGPRYGFAYSPDQPLWTAARGWLEVVPGAVTVIGGLLLLGSANRLTAMIGGWLAALAGGWFLLGRTFAAALHIGSLGDPAASTELKRALLDAGYFSGVGVFVVFLGGAALGSLSIVSVRDLAQPPAGG